MADREPHPHRRLSHPAESPDETEWPDPYDRRPDPLAPAEGGEERRSAVPGSTSTSQPHPKQDPEAIPAEAPKREKLDK